MFERQYTLFTDCKISADVSGVDIRFHDCQYTYNEKDRPKFDDGSGEVVTEYTGLAADKNAEFSWAKAVFDPKGSSKPHLHKERTEDYYITFGEATITIDNQTMTLKAGEQITILPNQTHHVVNASESDKLIIIVKCVPAWTIHDFHLTQHPLNVKKPENKR